LGRRFLLQQVNRSPAGRSWYIVGKNDRTVHPDLERFFAKRMGATTYELDSSHVPMLSQPERVLDVIRAAANAVRGRSAAAGQ
jgi:pimeloyl-ACP methyl ester carboxylesterase